MLLLSHGLRFPRPPSNEPSRSLQIKTIKGPAIFLAQFAGDAAPYNDLASISRWAAGLGYKGVQIPTWDARLLYWFCEKPDLAAPEENRLNLSQDILHLPPQIHE
jgi:hypothetical protein